MERANQFRYRPNPQPTVAIAQTSDKNSIEQLIRQSQHVHMHADWISPVEWIGQPVCATYHEAEQLKAYLAATQDPPPVAWLRALVIDKFDPDRALRYLLPFAAEQLRATNATQIACLAAQAWLDHHLPQHGFYSAHVIETLHNANLDVTYQPSIPITIRPVEDGDYEALAALDAATFSEPLWWHSAAQLRRGARYATSFDVALLGDTIVGFQYSTHGSKRNAHLVRLSVSPQHRGVGIGGSLLAQAFAAYTAQGLTEVTLNTQTDNAPARRLYEKFGFRAVGSKYHIWMLDL